MLSLQTALFLSLVGCTGPVLQDSTQSIPPEITNLTLSCERDAARWDLEVETSGWVSGATWWIAPPGLPVESHSVRSVSASPSGDYERLSLSLDQLSDPRLQEDESSTAALCPETETAMRVSIFDPGDGESADCREWGGSLNWVSLGLTEDCEIADLWW